MNTGIKIDPSREIFADIWGLRKNEIDEDHVEKTIKVRELILKGELTKAAIKEIELDYRIKYNAIKGGFYQN